MYFIALPLNHTGNTIWVLESQTFSLLISLQVDSACYWKTFRKASTAYKLKSKLYALIFKDSLKWDLIWLSSPGSEKCIKLVWLLVHTYMLSPILGYECNLLTQPRLGYRGYLCRHNIIPFYTCDICDLGSFKYIFTLTCLKQMNLTNQPRCLENKGYCKY